MGKFDKNAAGHDEYYYAERYTTLDFRGVLKISNASYWGFGNVVITASHSVTSGTYSAPMIPKRVIVDDDAWITSCCVLHNCHIKHHAIVSIGTVVNGIVVEPYTVVSGNPARVIAYWDLEKKKWIKLIKDQTS